jgi:hypothetical protein
MPATIARGKKLITTCAAFGRGAAVALMKEGERKEDILAGTRNRWLLVHNQVCPGDRV